MRVLVTGGTGFAGQWLTKELATAGHESAGADVRVDVNDALAVRDLVAATAPDVVVHLAAVSFAPDAAADPAAALATNVGGTLHVIDAVRRAGGSHPAPALVVSSAEVYAPPAGDAAVGEDAPLGPRSAYGLTKLAQESVAIALAQRHGVPVAVMRPFNHTGPGQREAFVVPALTRRLLAFRSGAATTVRVGNLDVERDIGDVRDVVRAYRLIAERLVAQRPGWPEIYNVATGRAVSIRWVVDRLAELLEVEPTIETDPELVRQGEPALIRGDGSRLGQAVGWRPEIRLEQTLAAVVADAVTKQQDRG